MESIKSVLGNKYDIKNLITRGFGKDQHALKVLGVTALGDALKMLPCAIQHLLDCMAGVDMDVAIDQNERAVRHCRI